MPTPRSHWIVSRTWDTTFIIATPLLCVAAVLPVKFAGVTSPQISLFLLAFFAVGHHLPTFLRAYGDSHLRVQHRVRLFGAPPLVFLAALWFSFKNLHGLLLVRLGWDVWHSLMQHYGFMRLYDSKSGRTDIRDSYKDLWLCVLWFITVVLWSPLYGLSIFKVFQQSTGMAFPAPVLTTLRAVFGAATVLFSVHYATREIRARRAGIGSAPPKIALLGLTLAFITWAWWALDDLFLGYAMWAIYHDIQYFAIVWIYNRKLVDDEGKGAGSFLAFLFRKRAWLLGVYLALVFSYGGVSWFAVSWFATRPGYAWVSELLGAFIMTSTLLHYWFDGFIWKVRDPALRRHLEVVDTGGVPVGPMQEGRRGVRHLAWFALPVAALAVLEFYHRPDSHALYASLADTYPARAEIYFERAAVYLDEGRMEKALAEYERALDLTDDRRLKTIGFERVEWIHRRQGETTAALHALEELAALYPDDPVRHADLGHALALAGRHEEALAAFERSSSEVPLRDAEMGLVLRELGRIPEAIASYRRAIERDPENAETHCNLGAVLMTNAERDAAEPHLRIARELAPDLRAAHFYHGVLLGELGRERDAREAFGAYLATEPGPEEADRMAAARRYLERPNQGQ